MELLWETDEPVDFDGKFYNLENAFLQIKPYERNKIPFYMATHTPKGLQLTGEKGDGWLPIDLNPDLYSSYLGEIKAAADNVGDRLTTVLTQPCGYSPLLEKALTPPTRLSNLSSTCWLCRISC